MFTRLIYALSVVLLLTAVACASPTTPTSPEPTATAVTEQTEMAVPPTVTAEPTPEPTATPTALELSNARATAVLTTLPGYDPDFHDALLPLARHLWGGEAALIDPALVALMSAPAHDLNPAGSLAVQVVDEGGDYPAGTLFIWAVAADEGEMLVLRPLYPDHLLALEATTLNNRPSHTWLEYDENGRLHRYLDPDSRRWIAPLDLAEDGRFAFFTAQEIEPDGRAGSEQFWWANDGELIPIAFAPNGADFLEYIRALNKSFDARTIDGQAYLVIIDAAGVNTEHRYNQDTGAWEEYRVSAVNMTEAVEQLLNQGVNLIHESINITPTDTLPGFGLSATERLYHDMEQVVAVVTNEDVVRRGLQFVHDTNRANNPDAPPGHSLYRTVNPITGQLETTAIPHNATINVHMVSGLETISTSLVPFYFGPSNATVRFGLHFNESTSSLNILIQINPSSSTDSGTGSQPHALWERVLAVFGSITNQVSRMPQQGGNVTSITIITGELRNAFFNTEVPPPLTRVLSINLFNAVTYLQHASNQEGARVYDELWGYQYPHNDN